MRDSWSLFAKDIERQTGHKVRHMNYFGYIKGRNLFYIIEDDGTEGDWCCTIHLDDSVTCYRVN